MKSWLDRRKCPAVKALCKAIAACPRGAVDCVEDEAEPLGGRMVFDPEKCDGCGLCARACCGGALEMR
jgi:NAD-dependent dihydropyrimidine dehydrogenase PreA subunit